MSPPNAHPNITTDEKWVLRLYIAGDSRRSIVAQDNLRQICDEHLGEEYSLEVIDLQERPEAAEHDRIFAVPTVVRQSPGPQRKIIGDMSDREQVLAGLGLPRR